MATAPTKLLTADEYLLLPNDGRKTELVRGEVIDVNMPAPRHGQICAEIVYQLRRCQEDARIGHVVSNDSAVPTEFDPDTVRGPDVAFYSYQRIPQGPFPRGYLTVVPEIVFEVRSPTDRWRDVVHKVGELLKAGVDIVCVVDDLRSEVRVFDDDGVRALDGDQELMFPTILPNFRVAVRRLFE